jgi:hypothetical protein
VLKIFVTRSRFFMPRGSLPTLIFVIAIDSLNSVIEGSLDFDPPTLTSALRIATAYDYPTLRTFAINKLEKTSLSAIERIRISREFSFTSWEAPAYVELCERDKAITEDEANVLGMSAFVQVAKIREKEQRRKGSLEADSQLEDNELEEERHEPSEAGGSSPQAPAITRGKKKKRKSTGTMPDAGSELLPGTEKQADGVAEDNDCERRPQRAGDILCTEFLLLRSKGNDATHGVFKR